MDKQGQKYPGQAQMRRDQCDDSLNQGQETNFLQETGTQVMNMAQGAADVGKGAAQGAVSLARGAATGAANIAQGAADAVKNTIGINSSNDNTTNNPNLMDSHVDEEKLDFPTMAEANPTPGNPNTKM